MDTNLTSKNFVDLLSNFNEDEVKKFVFDNGKERKVHAPISFESGENGGGYSEEG